MPCPAMFSLVPAPGDARDVSGGPRGLEGAMSNAVSAELAALSEGAG